MNVIARGHLIHAFVSIWNDLAAQNLVDDPEGTQFGRVLSAFIARGCTDGLPAFILDHRHDVPPPTPPPTPAQP